MQLPRISKTQHLNTTEIQVANQIPSHIKALDGLRGIAILMVLIHHLTVFDVAAGLPSRVAILADFCGHGVDLFFVLSGYLILTRIRADCTKQGWLSRFWLKRCAKIAPTYFACLVGVYLILPHLLKLAGANGKLAMQTAAHGNWPWYAVFASNLRNGLDDRFTNPALDVCWSLGVEVQFYALIAFGVFFFGIPRARVLAGAFCIALLTRTLAVVAGESWISILVFPWYRIDTFACGAAVALGCWKWMGQRTGLVVTFCTAAAALFLPWSFESHWVQTLGYSAVAISGGFFVQLASKGEGGFINRVLCSKVLQFLGYTSYSIYLTHLPLRAVLRDIVLPRTIRPLAGASVISQQVLFYALGLLVCVFAGWLVWLCFEAPMHRWLLKLCLPSRSAGTTSKESPPGP